MASTSAISRLINSNFTEFITPTDLILKKKYLVKNFHFWTSTEGKKVLVVSIDGKKMFLPDRYAEMFSEDDIQQINKNRTPIHLTYNGMKNISKDRKCHDFVFEDKTGIHLTYS